MKFCIREFASKMGGVILRNNNHLKVELVEPELEVRIEIRENGKTFSTSVLTLQNHAGFS